MLETIKHMLGLCGEPHGFLYNSYVYISLFAAWFFILAKRLEWWLDDRFDR